MHANLVDIEYRWGQEIQLVVFSSISVGTELSKLKIEVTKARYSYQLIRDCGMSIVITVFMFLKLITYKWVMNVVKSIK